MTKLQIVNKDFTAPALKVTYERLVCDNGLVTVKPTVGMGITTTIHTDRYAYTIVRVSDSGKTFWATRDKAIRIDDLGMTDSGQRYIYEPQLRGEQIQFRLTKRGWRAQRSMRVVLLGDRQAYHDYTF